MFQNSNLNGSCILIPILKFLIFIKIYYKTKKQELKNRIFKITGFNKANLKTDFFFCEKNFF